MAYHTDIVEDQTGKIKCALCKVFIRNSDIFIEGHLNDKEHTKMFMQRLMIQNNITINGNQISCGLCHQVTDTSKVKHHIDSTYHQEIMASIKEIIKKDGGLLVLPENITNIGPAVNCLACDRYVDFELEAIKTHTASARHRRARAIAVQPFNAIFSVENSNDDLWCKICQVYFENYIETIFEHVDEDPEHTKELNNLCMLIKDQNISMEKFLFDPKEDKALCKKCNMEVPCNIDNLERHIKGKKHTSM